VLTYPMDIIVEYYNIHRICKHLYVWQGCRTADSPVQHPKVLYSTYIVSLHRTNTCVRTSTDNNVRTVYTHADRGHRPDRQRMPDAVQYVQYAATGFGVRVLLASFCVLDALRAAPSFSMFRVSRA
jgi:hypothetical protein